MPGSSIGIGTALRRAREHRAKTIDEVSRDTHIRVEYLTALETESFDAISEDVYVRGFLRSYSQYLGLDADKVLASYSKEKGSSSAPAPLAPSADEDGEVEQVLRPRRTSSWILAGGIAFTVLLIAAAAGLLSASKSTPEPAVLPTAVPDSPVAVPGRVKLGLVAQAPVEEARITIDGVVAYEGPLQDQEARTFEGEREITVWFSQGGTVSLRIHGKDAKTPGKPGTPYEATFRAKQEQG
ncbi:MAG: helix-turn-helix transcriptional regulator [Actinomycetota bacterium]